MLVKKVTTPPCHSVYKQGNWWCDLMYTACCEHKISENSLLADFLWANKVIFTWLEQTYRIPYLRKWRHQMDLFTNCERIIEQLSTDLALWGKTCKNHLPLPVYPISLGNTSSQVVRVRPGFRWGGRLFLEQYELTQFY